MPYQYEPIKREPWNNVIYPGNYIARLNAYRNQGVTSVPGVNFFRLVGVFNPTDDAFTIDATTGVMTLPAGDYPCVVLSPDLRQDDKPRLDKPFRIPEGAYVYRTAIQSSNLLAAANGDTVKTNPDTVGSFEATLTSVQKIFPDSGNWTNFVGFGNISPLSDTIDVGCTTSADFTVIDNQDEVAIIVEVDFYLNDAAPDRDDINLPFKVVAGQSVN